MSKMLTLMPRVFLLNPNPLNTEILNLDFEGSNNLGNIQIKLFDMLGKEVFSLNRNITTDQTIYFSIDIWSGGIYIHSIYNDRQELIYSDQLLKVK